MLLGAALRVKEINPYDYCFKNVKVNLKALAEEDREYMMIAKYLNNSTNDRFGRNKCLAIRNIFKVPDSKSLNEKAFQETHNHYLLFHGTSTANVLSILEQNLRIAPQNAQ